jgi:hypothetical protein
MHNWFAVAIDFVIVVLGVYVAVWVGSQQAAKSRSGEPRRRLRPFAKIFGIR